jgi:LmbE family N-acetylglucosaminyl deacetylase
MIGKEKTNRVLMAVGAHADDIELNMGGTLLKYLDCGYKLVYIMATNNMSGGFSTLDKNGKIVTQKFPPVKQMKIRKTEAENAARFLGAKAIHLDHPQRHYNGPDGIMAELRYGCPLPETVPADVPTILTAHEDAASVKRLTDLIVKHQPEYVFTHGLDQVDMEHYGTMLLTAKAYWQAVEEHHCYGGLLYWQNAVPIHGDASCRWDTFIDVSQYLDKKVNLVAIHKCQMPHAHKPDFPMRVRAQSFGTACGCQAAEVFTLVNKMRLVPRINNQYPPFSVEIVANLK